MTLFLLPLSLQLMSYEIPMRQHPNMPFYCKPQILWSRAEGGTHRVSVMVGPKPMHSLSMKRNKEGVPSEAQGAPAAAPERGILG